MVFSKVLNLFLYNLKYVDRGYTLLKLEEIIKDNPELKTIYDNTLAILVKETKTALTTCLHNLEAFELIDHYDEIIHDVCETLEHMSHYFKTKID
jgi:hypothetical protein